MEIYVRTIDDEFYEFKNYCDWFKSDKVKDLFGIEEDRFIENDNKGTNYEKDDVLKFGESD